MICAVWTKEAVGLIEGISAQVLLHWNFTNWRKIGVNIKTVGFRIFAKPHISGLAIYFG